MTSGSRLLVTLVFLCYKRPCLSFSSISNSNQRSMLIRKGPIASSFGRVRPQQEGESLVTLNMGNVVKSKTTIAGQLMPFLSKLFLQESSRATIFASVSHAVDLREFAVLGGIAWGIRPLVEYLHNSWFSARGVEKEFEDGFWSEWSKNISWAAKIGVFIYSADLLAVVLNAMGFKYLQKVGFSRKAGIVSFYVFVSMRVRWAKRNLLKRLFRTKQAGKQRAKVYDRVTDAILFFITATTIIDKLSLDFGATLSSLFAFGGIGTLVLSLASKDLATQLVSGLAVAAGGSFAVGDSIKLGDGTSGTVSKIGLLYSEVRGGDEIVTRIPNSQVSNQRLSNISRVNKCQVKQTLMFSYDDIDKIPKLTRAIKEEISKSCPDLIADGSRPFRVVWTEYKSDHLEVDVDCRFDLSPKGGDYWKNRQAVLEAIARAVKKEDADFALPSYVAKNVDVALKYNLKDATFSPVLEEHSVGPVNDENERNELQA